MKLKKKTFIMLGLLLCLVFAFGITGRAETSKFDVTVTKNKPYPDPLSKRTIKGDYENRFYVTPTSFSNTGEIRGFSRTVDDYKGTSKEATSYACALKSNAVNVRCDNPYLGSAPKGLYCCLETYWGNSSVTNTLRVQGRYTP